MATLSIQQAIETAKQNPNSEFAKTLRAAIERGELDAAATKQGVDLSPFGRPKMSFTDDAKQDISQIGTDIKSDIEQRADKVGGIKQSGQSAVSKAFQTFGQGAGAVSDVVGRTVIGAGKAVLPQSAETKIADTLAKAVGFAVDSEAGKSAISRYQQLKTERPEVAGNIEAGANILSLLADVAGGVATKRVAQPVITATGKAARATGEGAEIVAKKTGQIGAKAVAETTGAYTGTSGETFEQAFRAAKKGGDDLAAYTAALRKQTTPEQLVEITRNGLDVLSAEKSARYGDMLKNIGNTSVDTSTIRQNVDNTLKSLNVLVDENGVLQFGASKFRTVPQAQAKLQQMYDEIKRIGKTQTINQIDTSRQALSNLLLTGDDASARTANLAITDAINKVRAAGTTIDEYADALRQFGDDASFLDELNRSLSTGDRATIDTAYRKLATTLKTNNEQRMKLLQELDERVGGTLLSSIAGQQLSEELPRGIFRQIIAGAAGAAFLTGGGSAAVLPALIFASPRVAGEIVRALGISAAKTKQVLEGINAARKLLVK